MNIPKPFSEFHTLDRLLSHGKTLVGALYFGRWRHGAAMFAEGMRDANMLRYLRKGPHNEIRPTKWVGTGCMLIHRSVFLDIEKKFPTLARNRENGRRGGNWFTSSEHDLTNSVDKAEKELQSGNSAKALQTLSDGKARTQANSSLGTGEDVIMCRRAAQAGHQPYVDLGLICGHLGHDVYGPFNTT